MTERILPVNGVDLCVETFGDPTDPAILLIHGACASMIWWETELCQQIAAHGRFVIRFDNRDTGRSTCYPPGSPGYAMTDLAADAIGVLDALGVGRAHVVGRSMAGGMALIAAVDHPDRVATITLVNTTTGDLPMGSADFPQGDPDYADPVAMIDYTVASFRAYAGGSPLFDEAAVRELAVLDIARTRNLESALTNHFAMDFDGPTNGGWADIAVPTLVVQGELDPVFPVSHGEALRDTIPDATLLVLAGAGHEVPPARWHEFVMALIRHTDVTP
ncbi:alpha/beta fold hydrolase [Actinokineospora sp. HUAS TT18]|uniref:alpha/beta fold hydrolase n=1 Tax=Actinokineospora sp. HUAS TT18 TaxID=3447451 RepID=UPI003F525C0C